MPAPDGVFAGRRVLVTGATGFIGSYLCEELACEGALVHAVSRSPLVDFRWDWHQADLSRPETARDLFRAVDPEYVFHLAALVTGSRSPELLGPVFANNLAATVHLLHAAVGREHCRMVLAGSLEEPQTSAPDPVPCSPYAAAKWVSSAYARMLHALYALDVVTARIFMVYGPGQRDELKLIPYVMTSLLRGEAPKLSSGLREVDWVYVDDVVSGLLALACAHGVAGQSVDLGCGVLTSIREVIEKILALADTDIEPAFGAIPDRPLERVCAADVARTKALLNWVPQVPLCEGLARTLAWYRHRHHALRTAGSAN